MSVRQPAGELDALVGDQVSGNDGVLSCRLYGLLKSWGGWLALALLVTGMAVFIFTHVHSGKPATPAQRIAQIEGMVRCPDISSCGGTIPVSDTNAPVAIEMKGAIAAYVRAGMSNTGIERLLTSRYGPGIMLTPSAGGLGLLLWLLPLLGGGVAAVMLLVVMLDGGEGGQGPMSSNRRKWRRYLPFVRTRYRWPIAVAVHAPGPGDVAADGFQNVAEDVAGARVKAGAMLRAGRARISGWLGIVVQRNRKVLLGGGIACLAAAASLAIIFSTHSRLSGEVATGSISVSRGQEIQRRLAQASSAENAGHDVTALSLYHDILAADPHQPQALAESGWITYETGMYSGQAKLIKAGESQVREALDVSPGSYAPHLYLGTIYFQQGDLQRALVQYATFLEDHPPKAVISRAEPFVKAAFAQAGKPEPAPMRHQPR
ncbi:MAG: cytochrome c-type biogenesis protein CcmH [Actinobacteria bacterium]|nr:cytochrome c-type biogenesis protein CcmH [Actinomycetota bacterium]